MTRKAKITLAILTLWPFCYFFIFLAAFVVLMLTLSGSEPSSDGPPLFVCVLFALHFATIIEVLALAIYYVVHLFTRSAVPQDKRALWAVVLILGNMLAMPVYWYFYIWPEREEPVADGDLT
jgi:hypothetical protein